ncbi:dephospho-CoA kinase [Niveispirillum cyanobacteriorum]|uniref:Dephospho-CoA kinase n=1 Tax=Niveispirillum cyanobacteriorum TaxID=1612173 RepID=A0A2K9NCP7_9PROT|nr:dephospho-CoA kinase [Niveispirillum cyanobacteriorum]AUN30888.1 dephospho-CoA kinase [Niveispirillum cyanobacteriorum]GGE80500.1 dephospho-CoA kinase [Niveispirillum cyanobacteriorum]
MIILGLTGSIGMGKSTAASMLRRLGCPVHDADASVHKLYARGGKAVPAIQGLFPDVVKNGSVDRAALATAVLGRPDALKRLEAAVHPLTRADADDFLKRCARRGVPVAVMDIPLLYETKGEQRVDAVIVVTAPAWLQRQRVLARPGMNAAKLANILARQVPDAEKRRRADFVVPTGLGRRLTLLHLRRIVVAMKQRQGRVWSPTRKV